MAINNPNSPRQKMINLMYLVFIGMLALNVSTEVLDGFKLVESGLLRTVTSSSTRNEQIFADLDAYHQKNPEKTQIWYDRAEQVKAKSDSLYNYTQDLKTRIVVKSDGKNGNPEHLKHPDDLNAAYEVMFEQGKNDATRLKSEIDTYREYISSMVTDESIKNIIENNLSTEPSENAKENKQSWEESMFFQMPVAAAVTLLTKLQSDIRYAEGEVLNDLLKNVDIKDLRVNEISAQVIPQSQIVMRGQSYVADIVASAIDSTQRPKVFVNGRFLPDEANGRFTVGTNATGNFPVKGYIELSSGNGNTFRRDFETSYAVIPQSATVAPLLMNVLYPGIDNDLQIAVPGIPNHNVTATMTNGTLTRKSDDIWTARPVKAGTEAVVSIIAKTADGRSQEMAKSTFKVRPLPPPSVFLMVKDAKGNLEKFEGGALGKSTLLATENITVGIDDGVLNVPFTAVKFDVMYLDAMGYDVKATATQGGRFTEEQRTMLRGRQKGSHVFIRGVVARGPDGSERTIKTAMDIIIN
ncbi:MAG: gliding motility protein GldM [Dysgonamonadaceae bacterium]|jgi:gliding motility-associated protein GldM|nr:gliding motility protein GldM [Dysgonamonadaceae bacterium]